MQNRKKPLLINHCHDVFVYEIHSKEFPHYGWEKITLSLGSYVFLPKEVLEILLAAAILVNKIFPFYEISDVRFLQLPHAGQRAENKNPNVMVTWQQANRRFLGSTIALPAYEKRLIII